MACKICSGYAVIVLHIQQQNSLNKKAILNTIKLHICHHKIISPLKKKTEITFVGKRSIGKTHLIDILNNDTNDEERHWHLQEVDTTTESAGKFEHVLKGKTTYSLLLCMEMKDIIPTGKIANTGRVCQRTK